MPETKITVEYLLGGWNPRVWKGDLRAAKQIALAEISEHCGGSSPAYAFTKRIFEHFESTNKEKGMNASELSAKAKKELNKDGLRYWLFFVYGYMTSSMDNRALNEFEKDLEFLKKTFPRNK